MPSPIGHALGGIAAGLLVGGADAPASRAPGYGGLRGRRRLLLFAALGMAPDLDLLVDAHNAQSHSLGAALLVGVAVAVWWGRAAFVRHAPAAIAAYASHVGLDWLNSDTTPPIGIMALWPFTTGYYQSDWHLFLAVSRRYWLPGFWRHTLAAVAWEVALLGPVCLGVWWWRGRRARSGSPAEDRVELASG